MLHILGITRLILMTTVQIITTHTGFQMVVAGDTKLEKHQPG